MLHFPADAARDFDAPVQREWLVTNGIGGYAMGTLNGARTRRYHGLLIAALQPPVGRWLMATALRDSLEVGRRQIDLSHVRFKDSAIGSNRRIGFALEGTTPVWCLESHALHLKKRIFMAHGANTTYIRYTLLRASRPVMLRGTVNAVFRDHHAALSHSDAPVARSQVESASVLRVRVTPDAPPLTIAMRGLYAPEALWTRDEYLSVEDERGFDHFEDSLAVAAFRTELVPGQSLTIVLSAEREPELDGEWAYQAHREREQALWKQAKIKRAPKALAQLVYSADQFIVKRALADGTPGHSVIAGYPWFGDWGRDTMIALPGLTLATRRYGIARGILTTFARYIDRGMLPNRFPDSGEAPEYNTADATLWYFEAVRAYFAATRDLDTLRTLYPALADIVAHHVNGTRYGIKVDPADGLLRAGEPGENLTWMDAKVDGVVMTPRHGKAVEICALWINALAVMRDFAARLSQPDLYSAGLAQASASFARFWDASRGYLKDVLDPDDATLRPNQLIAAMLPSVPLTTTQLRAIVDECHTRLYTPFGIRTLAPDDPNYHGVFTGDWRTRDSMYHQGPAWSWLLGPFISAHLRAYGDRDAARRLLDSALVGLYDGCAGSVSELFDGDSPHYPRAACAQAWGVAELLRVWRELEA